MDSSNSTGTGTAGQGKWQDRLSMHQRGAISTARRYVIAYRNKHTGKAREHTTYFLINDLAFMLDEKESVSEVALRGEQDAEDNLAVSA